MNTKLKVCSHVHKSWSSCAHIAYSQFSVTEASTFHTSASSCWSEASWQHNVVTCIHHCARNAMLLLITTYNPQLALLHWKLTMRSYKKTLILVCSNEQLFHLSLPYAFRKTKKKAVSHETRSLCFAISPIVFTVSPTWVVNSTRSLSHLFIAASNKWYCSLMFSLKGWPNLTPLSYFLNFMWLMFILS